MTISNYYVREYLHLYREYQKALNLSDLFLLCCVEILLLTFNSTGLLMIGSLSFLAVLAKSSVNFIIRIASDFSIREIYQADGFSSDEFSCYWDRIRQVELESFSIIQLKNGSPQ